MLGVLLGTALKFEGRFILQTKTDGPVPMLVVDFTTPDKVRACARFDKERVAEAIAAGKTDAGALLGRGHLAMTIDQGGDMSRYQGLVALEGGTLEDAAHEYFLRSEQIPTRVRLAVAEEFRAATGGPSHRWRAGGHAAAVRAACAGARARSRSRSGRCAGRRRDAHGRGGRCLGRGPLAGRDRRGHRADRSGGLVRAAALSAVPRARRARVPQRPSCARSARARARASRRCCARSRSPTATTWSRTA